MIAEIAPAPRQNLAERNASILSSGCGKETIGRHPMECYNRHMRLWTRLLTATGFVTVLAGLGVADVLWTKDKFVLPENLQATVGTAEESSIGNVSKRSGASLEDVFKDQNIEATDTDQGSLLSRIVGSATSVHTQVLLKDNDRILLFSWVENPEVKEEFQAIKDTLHDAFSANVSNLEDISQTPSDGPPYNLLSFKDPAISDERIIFLRIRQRLYELHVADGKDTDAESLIAALAK
jgi:hypothetical protein